MRKNKNNRKLNFEIGKGLALLTQLSISFLVPLFLSIWATQELAKRWQLGSGFVIFGILLGVSVGASSAYNMIAGAYGLSKKKKNAAPKPQRSIFEVDDFLRKDHPKNDKKSDDDKKLYNKEAIQKNDAEISGEKEKK